MRIAASTDYSAISTKTIAHLSYPSQGQSVMVSTNQVTQWILPISGAASLFQIFWPIHGNVLGQTVTQVALVPAALSLRPEWRDREYREAYLEASIEQGLAWQIRTNRERRGWSQQQLSSMIDTGQSVISRLEDPTYGSHSLETLTKLAKAFDCALLVKFVPYSRLAIESADLSPDALYAAPFSSEQTVFSFGE